MKQLRTHLVYLIIFYVTLFLMLYGSVVFQYELISVFAVILISVIMALDIFTYKTASFSRNLTALIAYTFYLVWLLLKNDFQPLSNFQSVYRIFTEMFMLAIGINLSKQISAFLDNTDEVMQQVTFSVLKPAISLEQQIGLFEKEFNRANRYERPLTILIVDLNIKFKDVLKNSYINRLQSEMMENYFEARAGHEIIKLTRTTDLVARSDTFGRFVILCPETSIRSVEYLGERIKATLSDRLDAEIQWGAAMRTNSIQDFRVLREMAERDMINRSINAGVYFKGEGDLSSYLGEINNPIDKNSDSPAN